MFNKIEIERFRGIKHASIEGFKQVNLFFGKNNCGKSTLLESLFLSSGLSKPILLRNVNLLRDYDKSFRFEDFILNFYNLDSTQPIHFKINNDEGRDLKINVIEKDKISIPIENESVDKLSNVADKDYEVIFDFVVNGQNFNAKLQFDSAKPKKFKGERVNNYEESLICAYLTPKYALQESIEGLETIIKNKDEDFIIDGLKIIDPRVKDFKLIGKELLVDIALDKLIPINMMGDGVRKIVSLLSTIYTCKKGIVLIDEISNGFHHSVMSNLWRVLINAAIKNETQLFITTHDYDSIKGLRDAALDMYNDKVAAFTLVRNLSDELKAFHYSLENLDYALEQKSEVR
jgi:AAA15 family ATPase/GTPase